LWPAPYFPGILKIDMYIFNPI